MSDDPFLNHDEGSASDRALLKAACRDGEAAIEALRSGDVLAADILFKLAIDQIDETGLIP